MRKKFWRDFLGKLAFTFCSALLMMCGGCNPSGGFDIHVSVDMERDHKGEVHMDSGYKKARKRVAKATHK